MKTKRTSQNKFVRIVSIPVKALVKAKDFYVRSMLNCSDRVSYGGIGAAPLPRSFSARSSSSTSSSYSNESGDYAELVRASSGKGMVGNKKMDVELYLKQHQMMMMQKKSGTSGVGGSRKMPRSSSVAMGKIDEDMPYVLGEDNVVDVKMQMKIPRSRSYAPKRSGVL